jgi:hypothetical protein
MTWGNEMADILVVMRSARKPGMPRLGPGEERAVQNYFRAVAKTAGNGLVSSSIEPLGDLTAVQVIVKHHMEPHGFLFAGTWLLPFATSFFTFRFEAAEQSPTGMRESMVMMLRKELPEIDEASGRILGWSRDPYDSRHDEGALYNEADEPRYDGQFPQHPLSRVRAYLAAFQQSVRFPWHWRFRRQHVV